MEKGKRDQLLRLDTSPVDSKTRSKMSLSFDANAKLKKPGEKGPQAQMKLSVSDTGDVTDQTYLPETFVVGTAKNFINQKNCETCGVAFGLLTSRHHCRRCCKCVCNDCSGSRRPLSKSDKSYYRVCDFCDKKLANGAVEAAFKSIVENREETIRLYKERNRDLTEKKFQKQQKLALLDSRFKHLSDTFASEKEAQSKRLEREESTLSEMIRAKKLISVTLKDTKAALERKEEEVKAIEIEYDRKISEYQEIQNQLDTVISQAKKNLEYKKALEENLVKLTGEKIVETEETEIRDSVLDNPEFGSYSHNEKIHIPQAEGTKDPSPKGKNKKGPKEKGCCG